MDTANWDGVAMWEPVISTVASITDYLQTYITPLSGIHASFMSPEAALLPASGPDGARAAILSFIKARYATIYSEVDILTFYLNPLFVPYREASRASRVKPCNSTDAGECLKATKRLLRTATEAERERVVAQVTQAILGSYPFLPRSSLQESAGLALPHVWWSLHADGAPADLRAVTGHVFSSAPTSAAGERSLKQRSHVHTRTRNRLSDGAADRTQTIFFNNRQARRFFDGVLLKARRGSLEKRLLSMLPLDRTVRTDRRASGEGEDEGQGASGTLGEDEAALGDAEDMAFWSVEEGGAVADARN